MTNDPIDHDHLPLFPTSAPAVFGDPSATIALFDVVLGRLADVVDVPPDLLDAPTPCSAFTVAELQRHVLGWLQFFAAALGDPTREHERIDPDAWALAPGQVPGDIVREAATGIARAVEAGVAREVVVMSQARMTGDGVLAMALGEYLVHGWDLTVATGRTSGSAAAPTGDDALVDVAAGHALAFLRSTVAPEYRGPDSGFFDDEIPAGPDASPFEQLLCFAGRRPDWSPPA